MSARVTRQPTQEPIIYLYDCSECRATTVCELGSPPRCESCGHGTCPYCGAVTDLAHEEGLAGYACQGCAAEARVIREEALADAKLIKRALLHHLAK